MSRKIKWNSEKYKIAILGDQLPGLRSVANGFGASDGYDLRRIDEWSPYQKRKVRDYYNRVHKLEAQERIIVRPRSKKNLLSLQEAFHGDIPSKGFKAAFVPYTQPKGLPGAKTRPPKISYLAQGISIDAGAYQRVFIPFNKKSLVKDAQQEIERILEEMSGAKLFFVQVGEFQTLNGKSAGLLTQQVLKYMHLYDGKKPLPRSSGNYGDAAKHHHWKYWLNGVVGYIFPKNLDINKISRKIAQGMTEAKNRRAMQDKKMRSTKRKKGKS